MKTSTKVWIAVSGILFVALGVICIAKPDITLVSAAWLLGCITLFVGFAKLVFTLRTQRFMPNSGTRMLSALLDIFFGCFFLFNLLGTAVSLPVVFALWVMIDSVIVAVQSFDYKKVGFRGWWGLLLFGIAGVVLGFLGLRNLDIAAATLSVLIGLAVISVGVAHLTALCGIDRFEKAVDKLLER